MFRSPRLHLAIMLAAFALSCLTADARAASEPIEGGGVGEALQPHIRVDDRVDYGGGSAIIDSYRSSEDPDAEQAGAEAIVALDDTAQQVFTMYNNSRVNGDVFVGAGGDPESVIATWSGAQITGDRTTLDAALDFSPIALPEGAPFDLPSEGNLDLWGSLQETISSDRRFHHVRLSNNAQVTIQGDVTLAVDGHFQVTGNSRVILEPGAVLKLYVAGRFTLGGSLNDGGLPGDVHVYMHGNGSKFETYGSAKIRAVVHAPTYPVQLWSNQPFFGLIQAERLEGGSPIHVDLDASFVPGQADFERYVDATSDTGFGYQTTDHVHYGSGWHWGDLNNDGYLDAIASGKTARRFMNNAGQSFTVHSLGRVRRQGTLVDFDHDGDLDYWTTALASHDDEVWLENPGTGALMTIDDAGFYQPRNNEGVAAADVNADGWCDLVMFSQNGNHIGHHVDIDPLRFHGTESQSYGLNDRGAAGNGYFCSSADVNNDGRVDFFYLYGNGRLFLSNGDGTYTWDNAGISVHTHNNDKAGSVWGDYDNDGDVDLFVCHADPGRQGYLYRNDDGVFVLANEQAGLTDDSAQHGCDFGDYDNDGDLDLVISTDDEGLRLFLNDGGGAFTRDDTAPEVHGDSHDVCFVDYDNDGDLDIALARVGSPAALLENRTDGNAFLKVRVIGAGDRATNVTGVGVKIELLTADGETLLGRRDLGSARGFAGSGPIWAHFGGVDPDGQYLVRAHFNTGVIASTVTPAEVSTTIGGAVVPQLLTLTEPPPPAEGQQITDWTEVEPR